MKTKTNSVRIKMAAAILAIIAALSCMAVGILPSSPVEAHAGLLGQYVVLTTLNRQDIDEELEKSKDQLLYPQYDSKKDLWGYVDENGKWVIEPEYKEAGRFTDDGVARVIKATGRTAYILKNGKESTVYNISGDYKDGDDFHNGVARVTEDDGTEKFINIYGTELKNYQG
ncbi:MAG: WG repeat-containing protein [Acutalibacteraceae bacterium]